MNTQRHTETPNGDRGDPGATQRDQARAVEIAGCLRVEPAKIGEPFCGEHDEDGNPPWYRCRWVAIAAALAAERQRARAPFLALADELERSIVYDRTTRFHAAEEIRRAAKEPK